MRCGRSRGKRWTRSTFRRGLGPLVLSGLREHGPAPVIEVPGEVAYWRFLVRPQRSMPSSFTHTLDRHGGRRLADGVLIELPPTRVPGGELRWYQGTDGSLPSLTDVVAAMLRSEHKSSER